MSDEFKQMRIVRDSNGIEADRIMSEEQYQRELVEQRERELEQYRINHEKFMAMVERDRREEVPEWVKALFGFLCLVAFLWFWWYFFTCGFC